MPISNMTAANIPEVAQFVNNFIFNNLACCGRNWGYMQAETMADQSYIPPPSLDMSMCPGKAFDYWDTDQRGYLSNSNSGNGSPNTPKSMMNFSMACEDRYLFRDKPSLPFSPVNKTLLTIIQSADKKHYDTYVENMVSHYIPCFLMCPSKPSQEILVFFHANAEDLSSAYAFCLQLQKSIDVGIHFTSATFWSSNIQATVCTKAIPAKTPSPEMPTPSCCSSTRCSSSKSAKSSLSADR